MTKLQNAVIEQLGHEELDEECKQTLSDITIGGADAGFSGFIYYSDTVEFYDKNKREILSMAKEMAEDFCEAGVFTMISNFNAIKHLNLGPDGVAEAIYNDTEDTQAVKNIMAWFALEEVARQLVKS